MTESQQSEGLLYFTLFNLHVNTYNEIINKQSFLSHIHHSDMSKVLKFLNSTDTDDTYRPPNSDLVLGDFPPYRTDCSCNMKTFIRTIAKNGWLDVQLPPKDLDMNEITDLANVCVRASSGGTVGGKFVAQRRGLRLETPLLGSREADPGRPY